MQRLKSAAAGQRWRQGTNLKLEEHTTSGRPINPTPSYETNHNIIEIVVIGDHVREEIKDKFWVEREEITDRLATDRDGLETELATNHRRIRDDYNPFKDTVDDHHLVIVGHDFWIPTVPEEMKPKEEAYYPSKEAIEEIYYTCM
ncbi:hypothetical protein LXL04_005698 [Taraxacum kok-saghyz]